MKVPTQVFSIFLFAFAGVSSTLLAAEPDSQGTLTAPAEVVVGAEFKIGWSGEAARGDFISVDSPDAESDREYSSSSAYPSKKNPVKINAPTEPGAYVIRYHLAKDYKVVAKTPLQVIDATASLQAPESAQLATEIKVKWSGPNNRQDFISIDPVDAEERKYGHYVYPRKGNPAKIRVPDVPGAYEIRYHLAKSYRVLGKTRLLVTDVEATVDVQSAAEAGGEVKVSWTGPAGSGDFISIDPVGSEDREYGFYAYPKKKKGNTVKIRVPQDTGEYEVRYHLARSYRVIATAPFTITGVEATLTTPEIVAAGSTFKVVWTGPGYPGDFIGIDKPDAEEQEYGNYGYAKEQGKSVEMIAPDEPGEYQLRYHLRRSYKVLGSTPLRVEPVHASLTAPDTVEVNSKFKVGWEGPGNPRDFITLIAPDAEQETYGGLNGYTRRGNPVRMQAPKLPGEFELRYLTGQKKYTLATRLITVTPGTTPGTLRVLNSTASSDAKNGLGAVELVLDASGSMLKKLNGERRIELARRALVKLTNEVLPADTAFALRVFGHKEADKCRTDLEIPLGPLDKSVAVAQIQSIQAMNLAKTPIGDSLLKIKDDLAGVEGAALIILVTDGEETCDGDPEAAIRQLQQSGFDVRVNIVGFAIDELGLKEEFESWAQLGNGRYFDAQSADDLNNAIKESLQVPYEVRQGDSIVRTGVVDGNPIELKPGEYQIQLRTSPVRMVGTVTIESNKESELRF